MEQHISHLNWFDTTIISIIVISTIFAVFRGFIKAVLSLFSWVASGYLAVMAHPQSLEYFSTKIHNDKAAIVVAFLAIFLIAFIIIVLVNAFIIKLLGKVSGGFVDRFLGLIFGALRGIAIVSLIFFSINLTSKMLHLGSNPDRPGPGWFAKAATYEMMDMATSTMLSLLPSDMPEKLERGMARVKDATISAMGDELEVSSSGASKTFTDQQRQLIKQVISSLPKEDIGDVYKQYDGNTAALSESEKTEIFSEILTRYKNLLKENKIPTDKIITDEQIQELEGALNKGREPKAGEMESPDAADSAPAADEGVESKDGELGYKGKNLKQMDRLVDGVNQE